VAFGLPSFIKDPLNQVPGLGSVIETDAEKRRRKQREQQNERLHPAMPRGLPEWAQHEYLNRNKPKGPSPPGGGSFLHKLTHGTLTPKDVLMEGLAPGRAVGDVSRVLHAAGAPKVVSNVPKDISDMGAGFLPAGGAVGKAFWHDLKHPLSGTDVGQYKRLAHWTYEDIVHGRNPKSMPKSDSELNTLIAAMLGGWGRSVAKAIPTPWHPSDVREAANYWSEHPVQAALDVLPVASAFSRPLSSARLISSIGRMNPELSRLGAVRAGIKESYVPGTAARAGLEGGIAPRTHTAMIGAEERTVQGRPWSRIPAMRAGQRAYDRLFLTEGAKQRRVARVEERLGAEQTRRIDLETHELARPIAKVVYGRMGKLVRTFVDREGMNAAERRRATALSYAFQMPRHMEPDAALGAVQTDLGNILDSGHFEAIPKGKRTVQQIPLRPDEKQALTSQIADIQKVRDELASGHVHEDEFQAALDAMSEISQRNHQMGIDILARRGNLTDEQVTNLEAAWQRRASILPRRLGSRGLAGLELESSPERAARIDHYTNLYGPEEAQARIATTDAMARGIRPNDPASFYADRVGMPTTETAQEYVARTEAEGTPSLFQAPHEVDELYPNGARVPPMPRKLKGVPAHIYELIKQGAPYRDWYQRGAAVIHDLADRTGITDAQAAAVVAITSQQANPTFNLRRAAEIIAEWKGGQITKERYFAGQADKVDHVLSNPETFNWAGLKTNSYFANFLEELDPAFYERLFGKDAHKVTVDRHIANMVLGKKSVTDAQYEKVAQMFTDAAGELGWKPKEVQAAAWVPWKAGEMSISEEVKALSREMSKRGEIPEELLGKTGKVQKQRAAFVRSAYLAGRRAEGYEPKGMENFIATAADAYERGQQQFRGTLYQQGGELPRGATEFLEGNRTRIHEFPEQGADPSTLVHELWHSSYHDLSAEDQATLNNHYAGGEHIDNWTTPQHEQFAKDGEYYVKRGVAPVRALESVFRKMANWIKVVWQEEGRRGGHSGLPDNVRQVFDRMFRAPDNADVYGYFPHRDITEIANQEYRSGVRPPARGNVLGRPQVQGINQHENQLIHYQTGRLSHDPAQLVSVFLRRLRFTETLHARDELWSMGHSLEDAPPPKGAWLIRNPDTTPEKIAPQVQAAVRGQRVTVPQDAEALDSLEGKLSAPAEQIRQEMIAKPGEHPEWAADEQNVRWVPHEYVQTRFGDVFEEKPRGGIWSALGLTTSLQRTTGIYGRPIAYLAGNIPFNVLSLMSTMPVSSLRNAGRWFRILKEDPVLGRRIISETGETRASGGLPNRYVSAQSPVQELEARATHLQRGLADVLSGGVGGRFGSLLGADTPYRSVAFLNNAAKRGYKTRAELYDLLDNPNAASDLADVRQLTREQMLDFNALNPSQRRVASQFLYLWPFIYASAKWPAMFAREYPFRAAVFGQYAGEQGKDMPNEIAGLWKKHGIDLSTINPLGPLADVAQQSRTFFNDPTKMDLSVLQDRLSPTLAAMVQGMSGGKKNALINFIRQTIPGAPEYMGHDPQFRGSKVYADRSWLSYVLQRELRFFPRGVNPEVVNERIAQYHSDMHSVNTHEVARNQDWKKIENRYKAVGGDAAEIRRSYTAWWNYQEAVDEKKSSTGQRKLTGRQTAEILDEVIRENYPEYTSSLWDTSVMTDAWQAKYKKPLDDYISQLKDLINAGRHQLFSDYSNYGPNASTG